MAELTIKVVIEVSGRGAAVHMREATFKLPERVYVRLERTLMDDLLQKVLDEYYDLVGEGRVFVKLEMTK